MPENTCIDCRFFVVKEEGTGGSGDCRRHAPVVTSFTETNGLGERFDCPLTSWPQVGEAQWCGDFEAAPEFEEVPPQGATAYKCSHCCDGGYVSDMTAEGNCPKCGENCMPF